MDKEIEVVTLEDNCDYVILLEVNMDADRYMVLSKEDDTNVVLVRKVVVDNEGEYLEEVKNKEISSLWIYRFFIVFKLNSCYYLVEVYNL